MDTLWPCGHLWPHAAYSPFWHGTFWQKSFRHEDFLAPWTFRHLNISAHGYFGTLQSNMDISAQTFRHLCYCAKMSMCPKFLVPNSPDVNMFPCWNVHLPERLQRQMVHVPKCSCDETSMRKWLFPKCFVPKWSSQFKTVQWITKPPTLLAGWEGSLGVSSR